MAPFEELGRRVELAAEVQQVFLRKGWPKPLLQGDYICFAESSVALSAFELDFDRAVAYCYLLLAQAPMSAKYGHESQVKGAPRHEYMRDGRHVSEGL